MMTGTLETIDGRRALRFERFLARERARLARSDRARGARRLVRGNATLDAVPG